MDTFALDARKKTHFFLKSDRREKCSRNVTWESSLPEFAVDVRYPPGVLSVKAHPLHLIFEPGCHVFPYKQRKYVRQADSWVNVQLVNTDKRWWVTWSAQLSVLLLLSSVHIHAPGVEGEGEKVLQTRRGAHYWVQPLQPFLTLLKSGELTPGNTDSLDVTHPAYKHLISGNTWTEKLGWKTAQNHTETHTETS